MHQKAGIAQANFAELYAVAADAITGMSYNFEIGVDGMFERVTQLVERIVEFDVEDHMQQLQKSVEFGHDAVKEFAIIQSAQKQVVEDQLSTSQALLQTIKDSQGQFHQIKETLDLIPTSWFEIFSQFRDSVDLLRNEARYALIFTTPSVVLLLFGRLRSAMVVILVYGEYNIFYRPELANSDSFHPKYLVYSEVHSCVSILSSYQPRRHQDSEPLYARLALCGWFGSSSWQLFTILIRCEAEC